MLFTMINHSYEVIKSINRFKLYTPYSTPSGENYIYLL